VRGDSRQGAILTPKTFDFIERVRPLRLAATGLGQGTLPTWFLVKLSFYLKDPRLATRLQAEHRQAAPERPALSCFYPEITQLNLGED
jgi:hypothetical protein